MESVQAIPSRRKIPKWLVPILGYAISLACLLYVFRKFPLQQLGSDIRALEWPWVIAAVVLEFAIPFCQAWRWWLLLGPVEEEISYWRCVQAIYVGLLANDILPARAGELIRCYLLSHWEEIPISVALTAAVIERLMDGIWMVVAFVVVTSDMEQIPRKLTSGIWGLAAGVFLLTLLFLFMIFHKGHAHSLMSGNKWTSKFTHVLDELHALGDWRAMSKAMMVSLVYFVLQILPIYALFRAGSFDLSVRASALVMVVVRLGTLVPNAPANIGSFQAACELGMRLVGVERRNAQTFGFLQFLLSVIPLFGGAIAVARTGMNINEIHHHAHTAQRRHHDRGPGEREP